VVVMLEVVVVVMLVAVEFWYHALWGQSEALG